MNDLDVIFCQILRLKMKQISGGAVILSMVLFLAFVSNIFCEPSFYPNGRYGRRSSPSTSLKGSIGSPGNN